MARQEIILGTAPTGLGGDPPRTASTKINAMTNELYTTVGSLGTASKSDVTVSRDEPPTSIPYKVTKQGDYGIGLPLSSRMLPSTPGNRAEVLARGTGFSLDVIGGGDRPPGVEDGPMLSFGYDTTQGFQIQCDWKDGTIHTFPSATTAPVKAWVKQYHVNNVTGTMALGAIMERGTGANGQWIKYSCGYMVCWTPMITPSLLNASVIGVVWTYPAPFLDAPAVTASLERGDIAVTKVMNGPHAVGKSSISAALYLCSQGIFVAGDAVGVQLQAIAHGWWK